MTTDSEPRISREPTTQSPGQTAGRDWFVIGILAFFGIIYTLINLPLWNLTYWDFGDGNYLYIGRRMNQGLVPYQDILAPQPPLHLILGALSQQFGSIVFDSELYGARLYNLVVRLLGALTVFWAGKTWFGSDRHGLAAAVIYLFLPLGFWWSLCLQSENVEIVFLMLAFVGVYKCNKNSLLFAGVASGLAMHINMTALPYMLCNAAFLLGRRPRMVGWYLLTALPVFFVGAWMTWLWAGAYYLDNVLLNQVGSFPREEITGQPLIEYAWEKITSQTRDTLAIQGIPIYFSLITFVVLWTRTIRRGWAAALGTTAHDEGNRWKNGFLYLLKDNEYRRFEYGAWYCVGMYLSICFTAKGGTANYIFVLGEPAVAMLAGAGIVMLIERAVAKFPNSQGEILPPKLVTVGVICTSLVLVMTRAGTGNLFQTIAAGHDEYKNQVLIQAERTDDEMKAIVKLIHDYSDEEDLILAPPFFAWAAERRIAGEFAESYLWFIKYINENYDYNNGLREDYGHAQLKVIDLNRMIQNQQIPIVFLDDKTTGNIFPVRSNLERFYQPLLVINPETGEPESITIQTRNYFIEVFVPKNSGKPLIRE